MGPTKILRNQCATEAELPKGGWDLVTTYPYCSLLPLQWADSDVLSRSLPDLLRDETSLPGW